MALEACGSGRGQPLASLGAATAEHRPATTRALTRSEAVDFSAATVVRLKGSLHGKTIRIGLPLCRLWMGPTAGPATANSVSDFGGGGRTRPQVIGEGNSPRSEPSSQPGTVEVPATSGCENIRYIFVDFCFIIASGKAFHLFLARLEWPCYIAGALRHSASRLPQAARCVVSYVPTV